MKNNLLNEKIKYIKSEDLCLKIEHETSMSGEFVSIITSEKGRYYLGGKYNTSNYAQIRAEQIYKDNINLQIFIGFGDGRIIREYCRMIDDGRKVLIYEPSSTIFDMVKSNYSINDIIENDILLYVGENDDLFSTFLDVLSTDTIMNMDVFVMDNYEKILETKIHNAIKDISEAMNMNIRNWATIIHFEKERAMHTFKNLRYFGRHYNVGALTGKIPQGVPVFVVAAGPSLNKNIIELKKAKGRSVIIACDTALKPLVKNGIIPDFFVVVDPMKPIELFDNDAVWDIPMLGDIEITPEIYEKHRGKKIIYSNTELQDKLIDAVICGDPNPEKKIVMLETGGSVSNTAFSFARLMGAGVIILVGQDLAATNGKLHVDGAFANERKIEEIDTEIIVDAIDGGKVGTRRDFKQYLDWFERAIKRYSETIVVDATEGGALIHGSKIMTLSEAIEMYCQMEFETDSLMSSIPRHFTEEEYNRFVNLLKQFPIELETIRLSVLKCKKQYEKIKRITIISRENKKEYEIALKKISQEIKNMESNILWDIVKTVESEKEFNIYIQTAKNTIHNSETVLNDVQLATEYLDGIDEAIDTIVPLVEELARSFM